MKTKNQAGRSMVEMLGVLAIVGVLSAGALKGYSEAMFKYKVNQTIDTFSLVLQRLIELKEKDLGDDFSITTADDIIRYGLLPECQKTANRCKLPIGELDVYMEDGNLCITVFFNSTKECVAIASVGWDKALPTEFKGEIVIQNLDDFFIYAPQMFDNRNIGYINNACYSQCQQGDCDLSITF